MHMAYRTSPVIVITIHFDKKEGKIKITLWVKKVNNIRKDLYINSKLFSIEKYLPEEIFKNIIYQAVINW